MFYLYIISKRREVINVTIHRLEDSKDTIHHEMSISTAQLTLKVLKSV